MGTVPVAPTWSTNVKITAANLQSMSDGINWDFATRPIGFFVQQTAQTGWTSGTLTAITFGASSEVIDRDGQHSTASNTSRVVIGNTLGWYRVSGTYVAAVNANVTRLQARIELNGAAVDGSFAGVGISGNFTHAITTGTALVQSTLATDYVEITAAETVSSGTPIGTAVSTGAHSTLLVEWLGY